MERSKRRSSMKQARPVPTIVVDKMDSTTTNSTSLNNSRSSRNQSNENIKLVENAYEPNDNNRAKHSLLRADTINEEDLTGDIKGSDSSDDGDEWSQVYDDDDNDESITMEEKMLQREIIRNFVHIKRKTQEAPVFNKSLTDRDTIMPSRFSASDQRDRTVVEEESDLTESEISDQDE